VTLSDETLMAYVDGELDATTRAEVEAAMLRNPELAQRIARQKALRSRVRLAFQKVADEPVPERLLSAARAAPTARRENNVVPLRRKPHRRWSWPEWGAMAASLVIGILAGQVFIRFSDSTTMVASRGGALVAKGALSRALSDQLVADQTARIPVQIGVSFRSRGGDYCRTFALHDSSGLAGMACHQGDGWRVQVLARGESVTNGAYRQAGSAVPKAVWQAVEETISGDPLDAQGEAEAKGKGWQR
jgi:anti-sigma factor RsiW